MTDNGIRPAYDSRDITWAAELITRSFDHLDLDRYVVPDHTRRPAVMRDFYHRRASAAAGGGGEVLLADGAVAVWFDRTGQAVEASGHEHRLIEITGPYLPRFAELNALFDKHEPAEPHWELAFLAVEADQRGRGVGSALIRHTHDRLDQQGIAAFLHATNLDNQRIYRRHGYTEMDPAVVRLPEDAGAFYPMWRPPAT